MGPPSFEKYPVYAIDGANGETREHRKVKLVGNWNTQQPTLDFRSLWRGHFSDYLIGISE